MMRKSEELFHKDKDGKKHDGALHDEILNGVMDQRFRWQRTVNGKK